MKRLLLLIIIILCAGRISAQTEEPGQSLPKEDKRYANHNGLMLGINQFPLLADDRNISFGQRSTKFNIVKYYEAGLHSRIRIGLDATVAPSSIYKFYFSAYYGGFELFYQPVTKHMLVGFGGDVVLQQDYNYSGLTEIRTTRFGPAPMAFLEWRAASFMSLRTDVSYLFGIRDRQYRKDQTQFASAPDHEIFDLSMTDHRLFGLSVVFHF